MQAADRKSNCRIFIKHDEKHVVPIPLSEIRVGKRRDMYVYTYIYIYGRTLTRIYMNI
jgi:hypothetical protein